MLTAASVTDQAIYSLLILMGLIVCFWGYRLLRAWLFLAGFQIGFLLALWLIGLISASPVLILIGALLCGCVLAGVCGLLPKIGQALASAASLTLLVLITLVLVKASSTVQAVLLTLAVLIGGLLGFLTLKNWLIAVTAGNGAGLVVNSIYALIKAYPANETLTAYSQATTFQVVMLLVGLLVLATAGLFVQLKTKPKPALPADVNARQASAATAASAAAAPATAESQQGDPGVRPEDRPAAAPTASGAPDSPDGTAAPGGSPGKPTIRK